MNCSLKDRKSEIQSWIKDRLSSKETQQCIFSITVPDINKMSYDNTFIMEICNMFDKYGIKYSKVDTMPGDYNLNRDWIETEQETPIECIIEYCGVYPVWWEIEDVVRLEHLNTIGEILIRVVWIMPDGKMIENN